MPPDASEPGTGVADSPEAAPAVAEWDNAVTEIGAGDPVVAQVSVPEALALAKLPALEDLPELAKLPELGDLTDVEGDEPEIPPWDRRPLMIVIAAAAAFVLLAVLSGMASASMFRGNQPTWQEPASNATSPTPTAVPVAPPVDEQTVTLSGVGDVIMGSLNHGLPPNDGAGFFDPVRSALASDLVMGNLESPLTADTGVVKCSADATNCFQFYLPPSYANHLRAGGFDVLNLANNHGLDMGAAGLRNTRDALEAAGIRHTGAPDQITTVDVKGVKVAVLGFSGSPSGQDINDIPAAEELVRKADAEADIVVIQMQGGSEGGGGVEHVRPGVEEYGGQKRGDVMAFSRAVIDAGADVIMGHGPHIMRGMEFYKGRLIAYSLGNFCGYKTLSSSGFNGVGGVLKVTLKKDGSWVGGQLIATEMVNGGLPALDPDKRALAFVNGLSQEDFGPAAAVISESDGVITPPATP